MHFFALCAVTLSGFVPEAAMSIHTQIGEHPDTRKMDSPKKLSAHLPQSAETTQFLIIIVSQLRILQRRSRST